MFTKSRSTTPAELLRKVEHEVRKNAAGPEASMLSCRFANLQRSNTSVIYEASLGPGTMERPPAHTAARLRSRHSASCNQARHDGVLASHTSPAVSFL